MATEEQKAARLFARAREIVNEAEIEAARENDSAQDTIQKLAFRIAKLEHADRDEYGSDE